MSEYKVVITDEIGSDYEIEKKILDEVNAKVEIHNLYNEDDLIEVCHDADGILCNLAKINSYVIEHLDKCKIISRYGIGYDNIDIEACGKRNIYVANVPDYCFEEVAEHTIALLLDCVRKITYKDKKIRNGKWDTARTEEIFRLSGKNLVFIGFGNIPKTIIKKIKLFGFKNIIVYDPYVNREEIEEYGAEKEEFDEAIKKADYILIHLPLNKRTKNMINKDVFNNMKQNAIVINTSRGGVVEQKDLIDALREKRIYCAGLDVYSIEPLPKDSPLIELENCVLTDQAAFYSVESIIELKKKCAENVSNFFRGLEPVYLVDKIKI
jgi:D-3-phosphoglycerate dehydrogenase / 2-oxoglutarate reductase